MNTTYLFYDIETTGLNKCFDQVLQFAAIRTDEELNELERTEIQVRLNPDVIPAPQAVITHRIGPKQFENGLNEYEAMQQIHTLLNTPGTISVGYNSLGFDDEFLRFSFYRNLLSPYTHQYANRCGRMDIYPITLLYYLFKKDHLIWPDGNLKLENINHCNQFATGLAHNAMVDVEVTLALAKKLAQDGAMWRYVTSYFQKQADELRMNECESVHIIANHPYTIGYLINGKIGSKSQYIAPVIYLGPHLHYKNQQLWLRLDDANLTKTTADTISKTSKVFRKKFAEPPIFLPIKPRYLALLSEDRQKITENNLAWLTTQPALFRAIANYHQHDKYPDVPERDIDAALYNIDFPTASEERLFKQFHEAPAEKKCAILDAFPNSLRQAQGVRVMGRHYQDALHQRYRDDFKHYLQLCAGGDKTKTPIDFRGEQKLTVKQALQDIIELEKSSALDDTQKTLLLDLKAWLEAKERV